MTLRFIKWPITAFFLAILIIHGKFNLMATTIKHDTSKNHLEILRDVSTRMFVEDLLCKYWEISGLPVNRLTAMLNILSAYYEEPEFALQLVQEKFPDLTDQNSTFYQKYQESRSAKFRKFSRSLVPYIKGKVLADIGGEDSRLLDVLTAMNPSIEKGYVTDINMAKSSSANPKIEFLLQSEPDKTPLEHNSVDSVIMSTMLHHITPFTRLKLMTHVKEILRQGGRLVLIEDSYPENPTEKDINNSLDERYLAFNNYQKKKILSFFDWWGNRLMKNSRDIPLPCTFKSMEEWEEIFGEMGLKLVQKHYLGIPDMHTHIMAPKAIMIFENVAEEQASTPSYLADSKVKYIERTDFNREMMAFVPKNGLQINLSIGGSKIQTAVIDKDLNEIVQLDEYYWRKDFMDNHEIKDAGSLQKREWLTTKIIEQIMLAYRLLGDSKKSHFPVEGVGIAWAGPVKALGRIIGPNIDGFKFQDLTEDERKNGGIDLSREIQSKLRENYQINDWTIQFLNDGDAAAIANFKRAKLNDGLLLTIGTGIGSGIVSNGEVLYSVGGFKDRIGEIGHHILYHPEHHRYFYYGVLTRGKIVEEMTSHSISQRLAGPGLAKKFVVRLNREMGYNSSLVNNYLNSSRKLTGIHFSEIELAACEENVDLGPIIEKKIIKLITHKANAGNKSAISFIKEVGYELGLGIGVFIKEFEKESYVQNIIVAGSVGKSFGRGLVDESGKDLFLSQILKGISWSMDNHYVEMNPQLMLGLNQPKPKMKGASRPSIFSLE